MEKRVIVSGGGEIREWLFSDLTQGRRIRLEGAGALCASDGQIYCACDWGDVIWRLDAEMLVPTALFAGGPGICDMAASRDGKRLYALCAGADSLLALSASSGTPMMVNRVGVNPCAMAMDETGDVLAVAGGECGQTVLLSAHTLDILRCLPMPGMVYGVAMSGGIVYSLCLNETLASTLTTVLPGGIRQSLTLAGMPGALTLCGGKLLAATHEHLYTISADGARVLGVREAAGRARRILHGGGRLMLCDELGEALFTLGTASGRWRLLCEHARDAMLL